jgi:excisionase family DNA binding protein
MIPRFIGQMGMSKSDGPQVRSRVRIPAGQCLLIFVLSLALTPRLGGQTASTGALMGVTLDPSGAVLGGVTVRLNRQNVELQSVTSDQNGRFGFLLLPSGTYEIRERKGTRTYPSICLAGCRRTYNPPLHWEVPDRIFRALGGERPADPNRTRSIQTLPSSLSRIPQTDLMTQSNGKPDGNHRKGAADRQAAAPAQPQPQGGPHSLNPFSPWPFVPFPPFPFRFYFANSEFRQMDNSEVVAAHPVFGSVRADAILLDAGEVAQILHVPRSWVYSHLQELPAIRLGRYVRFRRSAIERFLEQRAGACQ